MISPPSTTPETTTATLTTQPLRVRALQAGRWVTAGFIVDKIIAAVQLVVLARLLTPADFGLVSASAAVLLLFQTMTEVGLESALVVRRNIDTDDLSSAWLLQCGRGVVLTAVLWAGADIAADFFRNPALAPVVRIHALAFLVQGVQSPALAMLLRDLNLGRRVRLDLTRRGSEAVVTIILALWLRSVWALVVGQLVGFAVGTLLSYRLAPFRPTVRIQAARMAALAPYAKHVNATTVLIFASTSGGEFVVGRWLGTEMLGLYQIALAIPVMIGTRASIMMSQVAFPAYARLQDDPGGLRRAFALQIRTSALVIIPLLTILAVFAPSIIELGFGPRWVGAAAPVRLLCVYGFCAWLSGAMASLHYGLNRPELQTRIWAGTALLYAALVVPAVQAGGLMGAAGALVMTSLAGLLLHIRATVGILGPEVLQPTGSVVRQMLVAIAVAIGFLIIVTTLELGPAANAVVLLPLAALYVAYLWRVEWPMIPALWKGTA